MKAACYTFSNIPKDYLRNTGNGREKIIRISTEEEKFRALEKVGMDDVFSVPFDRKTMSVSAEEFVKETLAEKLNAGLLCCGFNYTFGRNAEGNADRLRLEAAKYGTREIVQDAVYVEGKIVSSTRIRELLHMDRKILEETCDES